MICDYYVILLLFLIQTKIVHNFQFLASGFQLFFIKLREESIHEKPIAVGGIRVIEGDLYIHTVQPIPVKLCVTRLLISHPFLDIYEIAYIHVK